MAGRLKVDDVTGKVSVEKPMAPTVPSSLAKAAQHLKTGKYAPTPVQSVMPAPFDED